MNQRLRSLQLVIPILVACVLTIPAISSAQLQQLVGSEWIYNFDDEFEGIALSGTYTYSSVQITNTSLGGELRQAVEFRSVLSASASGTIEGTTYDGVLLQSGSDYYDVETDKIIGTVSDQYFHMRMEFGTVTMETAISEHNATVYVPPGGLGIEPTNVQPGDQWSMTYVKHSNASGLNDGRYFEEESNWSETIEYEYEGTESVTVPAGTFECTKFQVTSSMGVQETEWYAAELSGYAKIVDIFESGERATYELSSYDLHEGSGGTPTVMAADLFRAAFFTLIGATALAAVSAAMIFRRKRPPAVHTLPTSTHPFPIQRQEHLEPNQP